MKTLNLNLGERMLINTLALDAKGTSSFMRTVKRARYAIDAYHVPEKIPFNELRAQDSDTRKCEFADDAWDWLVATFTGKGDFLGVWADWVDTLADKLSAEQLKA